MPIIILNAYGLNTAIKIQKLAERIKKHELTYAVDKKLTSIIKIQASFKRYKKTYHANIIQEKAGVTIFRLKRLHSKENYNKRVNPQRRHSNPSCIDTKQQCCKIYDIMHRSEMKVDKSISIVGVFNTPSSTRSS